MSSGHVGSENSGWWERRDFVHCRPQEWKSPVEAWEQHQSKVWMLVDTISRVLHRPTAGHKITKIAMQQRLFQAVAAGLKTADNGAAGVAG